MSAGIIESEKIMTVFLMMFSDINRKLKMTVVYGKNDLIFNNNLQILIK